MLPAQENTEKLEILEKENILRTISLAEKSRKPSVLRPRCCGMQELLPETKVSNEKLNTNHRGTEDKVTKTRISSKVPSHPSLYHSLCATWQDTGISPGIGTALKEDTHTHESHQTSSSCKTDSSDVPNAWSGDQCRRSSGTKTQ